MPLYHLSVSLKGLAAVEVKVNRPDTDTLLTYLTDKFEGKRITGVKILDRCDELFIKDGVLRKARANGIPSYKQDLSFADRMKDDRLSTQEKEERIVFLKRMETEFPNMSWDDRYHCIMKT